VAVFLDPMPRDGSPLDDARHQMSPSGNSLNILLIMLEPKYQDIEKLEHIVRQHLKE
jgi:hypothetical protein